MSFEKLMGELHELQGAQETLSKALPADDGKDEEKVQAAAAEGGSDETGAAAEAGGAKEEEGGEAVVKSFKITLDDGTEVDAQDGTALIKSLQDRIELGETNTVAALTAAMELIRGQGEMIKSLSATVSKFGNQGAGRKAVLSVVQKPTPGEGMLAKSEPTGMSPDMFFAKALDAQRAGRITGTDIAVAEAHLNRGEAIPASIVSRVVA